MNRELALSVIEYFDLNRNTRIRKYLFKRYYLIKRLREDTLLSLEDIGSIFGFSHSNVVNALKQVDILTETRNKDFQIEVDIIELFLSNNLKKGYKELKHELKKADTLIEFHKIKNEIINNIYL